MGRAPRAPHCEAIKSLVTAASRHWEKIMGWTFSHKSNEEKPADYLARTCLTWNSLPEDQRPMEVGRSGKSGVVVFAVRFPAPHVAACPGMEATHVPAEDGSITLAMLFLTRAARDHYNFGYKDMDETMGPCETGASKGLLAMLSPLQEGERATYAREWRKECAEAVEMKSRGRVALKNGAKVHLAEPVTFADGMKRQDFTVSVQARRNWKTGKTTNKTLFRCVVTGGLCKFPLSFLASANISNAAAYSGRTFSARARASRLS
jgi:hypothetical protein